MNLRTRLLTSTAAVCLLLGATAPDARAGSQLVTFTYGKLTDASRNQILGPGAARRFTGIIIPTSAPGRPASASSIETLSATMFTNAPGCDDPSIFVTGDEFEVDWGFNCVDFGESFTLCFTSGDETVGSAVGAFINDDEKFPDTLFVATGEVGPVTPECGTPDCSGAFASPSTLWPPNHKFQPISIQGIVAPRGGPVSVTVTGVTQDEPVNGTGDGNTCPDAQIDGGQVSLRAERTGTAGVPGNGRVYMIHFTATDTSGHTCDGVVSVCVPHDQGDPTCVDDGQKYNSLASCRAGDGSTAEGVTGYTLKVGAVVARQATLEFSLPVDATVEIAAFDVSGRRVATIENGRRAAGVHQRAWNLGEVPSGMYFVRMRAGDQTLTRTVLNAR